MFTRRLFKAIQWVSVDERTAKLQAVKKLKVLKKKFYYPAGVKPHACGPRLKHGQKDV